MITPYENLANAIVLQSMQDYRRVISRCRRYPEKATYRREKESLERFFSSDWFTLLSGLEPEIIDRLNCEVTV